MASTNEPVKSRRVVPSRSSEPSTEPRRAQRACEKCTRTKKRCDKALPACSRCKRLKSMCCYNFTYTPPITVIVEPKDLKGSIVKSSTECCILDPSFDMSSFVTTGLWSMRHVLWREAVQTYFGTTNLCLAVVHPELFAIRSNNICFESVTDQQPRDPTVALLIICMQLVSLCDTTATADRSSSSKRTYELPTYRAAKQSLSILRSNQTSSIELIQSSILLAFFEYLHNDFERAFISVGDAKTMALILKVNPGKYVNAEQELYILDEEEERRCIYWSLFVVDRLIHLHDSATYRPLQISFPAANDLLPTKNTMCCDWDPTSTIFVWRYPASIELSVPVGLFQRNCQWAMMCTRASSSKWVSNGRIIGSRHSCTTMRSPDKDHTIPSLFLFQKDISELLAQNGAIIKELEVDARDSCT